MSPALTMLPPVVAQNLGLFLGGVVVLLGLFLYGIRDLLRLRPGRIGAIAGVCFKESIRRRVLWVTPLAMLGVLGISRFVVADDAADSVRQVTSYCFFASGLIAVLTCIVLACTNLPRDMESKVIFTIVTKPATRLEIIFGKIAGFSGTAAAVLGVMGLFTLVYLTILATGYQRSLAAELDAGADPTRRLELEHFSDVGLLTTRSLAQPEGVQIFAREPTIGEDYVYISGAGGQTAIVAYDVPAADFIHKADAGKGLQPGANGAYVKLRLGYQSPDGSIPETPPTVQVDFLDENDFRLIDAGQLVNNGLVQLTSPDASEDAFLRLAPESVERLAEAGRFLVRVKPLSRALIGFDMASRAQGRLPPVQIVVPNLAGDDGQGLRPAGPPVMRGRSGSYGQQLVGPDEAEQVAVFRFRDIDADSVDGRVPIEMRLGVQRGGEGDEGQTVTDLQVTAVNRTTGERFGTFTINPETLRPLFFSIPAEATDGGDFDLILRNTTPGHLVGLTDDGSAAVVTDRQPFVWNILKAYFGLWLLCVLVVSIGVFSSTFLSWPIATVLTVCLLMGRWAVDQVRDTLGSGFSQRVAGDLFQESAGGAAATRATVDVLSQSLVTIASLLPDLGPFATGRWLEAGTSVPMEVLAKALIVTVGFGLPVAVLGYVFLRNKEVAA